MGRAGVRGGTRVSEGAAQGKRATVMSACLLEGWRGSVDPSRLIGLTQGGNLRGWDLRAASSKSIVVPWSWQASVMRV